MKKLILLLLLLLPIVAISQRQIEGTIIKVSDGDTYKLKSDENDSIYTIRMLGIDTPELKQEFGAKSKMFVSNLILNKHVCASIKGKDKYKRYLANIYYGDSLIWLNKQIISSGNGVVYMTTNKVLLEEERKAKVAKRGVWSNDNFVSPAQYRKNTKKKK